MRNRFWNRGLAASVFSAILVVLIIVALFFFGGEDKDPASAAPAVPAATPTPGSPVDGRDGWIDLSPDEPAEEEPPVVNADAVVTDLFGPNGPLEGMQGQVAVGSANVDFDTAPQERGTAAFSGKTLKAQADVAEFLNASTPESQAANTRVVDAIRAAGYGEDEVARALDGTGYFPLQVEVAAQILGTTYFKDGKVLEANEWRTVQEGDIFWFFLTKDNHIIVPATIRADCANPGLVKVRPITPQTPPAPSVECAVDCEVPDRPKPTEPPATQPPPTKPPTQPPGLTPKQPSKDPQSQNNVPPPARKDEPSKDNKEEVSKPAEKPQDSGNGIPPSSKPRATPSPQPTHVESKPSPQPRPSEKRTEPATSPKPVEESPDNDGQVEEPPPPPA